MTIKIRSNLFDLALISHYYYLAP